MKGLRLFLFLSLLIFYSIGFGQDLKERLYEIIAIENSYPDSALHLSKELLNEGLKENDSMKQSYANFRIGSGLYNLGRFDEAITFFRKAYSIRLELKDYVSSVSPLELMANSYFELGKIDSAFICFTDGLRILDQTSAIKPRLLLNIAIANALMEYKDFASARKRLNKANDLLAEINDLESRSLIEESWGVYYYYIDSLDQAIVHYKNAFQLSQELESTSTMINNCSNLALCYSEMGNDEMSLYYNQLVYNYYSDNKMDYQAANTMYNMGLNFQSVSNLDSAEYYFSLASQSFERFQDLEQQYNCLASLTDIYLQNGDFKAAALNQKRMIELKDSILDNEKIARIAEVRTEYESEKKEQKISLLNAEARSERANKKIYLFSIAIILLLLLFILYRYKQREKLALQEQELSKKKIDLLMGEQELITYNALLEGQEEERKRIARDLHDQVGSLLSSLKFQFSSLPEATTAESKKLSQYGKMDNLIDHACEEVRRISHNLNSGILASFGLEQALRTLCNSIDEIRSDFNCEFSCYGLKDRLKNDIEREIYRIAQEVINNCLKHANASRLLVQITNRPDAFTMIIEDNGKGFDQKKALSLNQGLGLQNLFSRAQKVGGKLTIDSSPNKGSVFTLEINYTA